MEELHLVLGASGGWGNAIAHELVRQGKRVRGTSRSGNADVPEEVDMVSLDIMDKKKLRETMEGVTTVYHCINVPYSKWVKELIPIAEQIVGVVEEVGVPLVVVDNLYMYPEDSIEPLNENMQWAARGKKGKARAELAKLFLDAHSSGRIEVVILRAPDFFGPGVKMNSFYSERVFLPALEGKKVSVLGNPDVLHTIAYTPDLARATLIVAGDLDAYGQVWHLPSTPAVTQRQFVEMVFEAAGTVPKIGSIGMLMVRIGGLFNSEIRELSEIMYEFEKPYLVSHEKFSSRYKFELTPLNIAISETMMWFKNQKT